MTSPVEKISILCPNCGTEYEDWWRPSVNLALDDFDEEYFEACSSAVCPDCGFRVDIDMLIVDRGGDFYFRRDW